MHSRRTLHSIAVALFAIVITASAQNTNYAQRIACDMDDPASGLIDLHWLQGAAPILEITPTRGTARIAAQTNVTVELIFSQTPTNALFVKTNAYLASGTSYWMQFGTIGTNSCDDGETIIPSPWWYTVLFSNAGGIYWSGNGRLYIHPTTATGTNGVTWQEWEAGSVKDDIAREWIRQLSNVVENIEVGDIHYGTAYTNVYRGSWGDFASNLAATAYGWGNHAAAGYVSNNQRGVTLEGRISNTNTAAPANDDLARAGWVRDQLAFGYGISAADATNIAKAVVAAATTNDMTNVNWSALGGSASTGGAEGDSLVYDWATNIALVAGTNLYAQRIAAISGPTTITPPTISNTNYAARIWLTVPPRGTNAVSILTNSPPVIGYVPTIPTGTVRELEWRWVPASAGWRVRATR